MISTPATLRDGSEVALRPIRPEDGRNSEIRQLLHELLRSAAAGGVAVQPGWHAGPPGEVAGRSRSG